MGFISDLIMGKYKAKAKCLNYGKEKAKIIVIEIVKGISQKEWTESGRARCTNRGCIITEDEHEDNSDIN